MEITASTLLELSKQVRALVKKSNGIIPPSFQLKKHTGSDLGFEVPGKFRRDETKAKKSKEGISLGELFVTGPDRPEKSNKPKYSDKCCYCTRTLDQCVCEENGTLIPLDDTKKSNKP